MVRWASPMSPDGVGGRKALPLLVSPLFANPWRSLPLLVTTVVATAVGAVWALVSRRWHGERSPRAAFWLASMWTADRSKTPHILRGESSGLRPMAVKDWVVVELSATFVPQMTLRRRLLADGAATVDRFYATLAGEATEEGAAVLAAEQEVLALLLVHLEAHCGATHTVVRRADGRATAVIDRLSGQRFDVEAHKSCPLKLAAKLVQEDFILLSEPTAGEPARFVGGCALFSFMEVGLRGERGNMNLSEPLPFIHQNVPGFNDPTVGVGAKVALFLQQLVAGKPYFRTNWLLVPEKGLDPMRYSLSREPEDLSREPGDGPVGAVTYLAPHDMHLRVELQSISRLPETGLILFTIHTYSDPLSSLSREPRGAAVLRQAVLALDAAKRKYRGMSDDWTLDVAEYLGQLAGNRR